MFTLISEYFKCKRKNEMVWNHIRRRPVHFDEEDDTGTFAKFLSKEFDVFKEQKEAWYIWPANEGERSGSRAGGFSERCGRADDFSPYYNDTGNFQGTFICKRRVRKPTSTLLKNRWVEETWMEEIIRRLRSRQSDRWCWLDWVVKTVKSGFSAYLGEKSVALGLSRKGDVRNGSIRMIPWWVCSVTGDTRNWDKENRKTWI